MELENREQCGSVDAEKTLEYPANSEDFPTKSLSGSFLSGGTDAFPHGSPQHSSRFSREGETKSADRISKTETIVSTYFPMGTSSDEVRLPKRTYANVVKSSDSSRTGDGQDRNWNAGSTHQSNNVGRRNISEEARDSRSRRDDEKGFDTASAPRPVNPFAIHGFFPGASVPPFAYHPEALKWMQMYGSLGGPPSKNSSREYEALDSSFKFQSSLAKSADDRTKKHLHNLGKTIKTIARIVGTLETAYLAVRGCFHGLLHALEYGTHGWQLLSGFPLVRLFFISIRQLWRYIKFVGRNGPLVGFFALICTVVGRAVIPFLRRTFPGLGTSKASTVKAIRSYAAKHLRELTVQEGEELTIEDLPERSDKMVMVKSGADKEGIRRRGLVPRNVIEATV